MRLVARDGRPALDLDDPELRLTAAQRRALATDRELVLTAGAGAGKTHTLSLRYVALLLELALAGESDVERVLVLTFTERAAAEMAERCHRRLAALVRAVREQFPGHPAAQHLERMEDRFDRARIGTFHGFCAAILREFPAETRTAPGARVLEPAEARRLVARVLDEALEALVRERPHELAPLLDAFGSRAGLLEAGGAALDRRGILEPVLAEHASDALPIAERIRRAPIRPEEAAAWTDGTGIPALRLLERLVGPSGGGPWVDRVLRPALAGLQEPAGADPLRIFGRYRACLDALLNDAGQLRALDHHTVLGTRDQWPDERRYKLAKAAAGELARRSADWPARARTARKLPTAADAALLAALGPFGRWVLDAARRLDEALDRAGALTFEVMQLRAARAVLADERLRLRLRERFRWLMVDEFQDTDEVQWALVKALGRADPEVAEDRIFVVGDPKQAIYGFRGGDVTVFRRARQELGAEPVVLAENFRSRPALVDWVNRVFPSVLGPGEAAWEVPYDPMVAGRADPGGRVRIARAEDGPELVARWIAAALAAEPAWHDRALHPTPPFAILLRARTRQPAYEAALRRNGVPYVVAQGVAFWQRPEVVDVVNALAALVHGDPISTVGLLRSPLGGLLDQDLQDLGGRLPEALPDHAPERLRRAALRLARWRRLRERVPPSALVRALGQALLPALAATDPTGQAEANVLRLAELVVPLDPLGAEAAADRLLAEVVAGARESEAVIVPTAARVVLCTVHASKGLEFPVVVVPELDARPSPERGALLVARPEDKRRFAIAARILDPDAEVQTRVKPGLYAELEQVRRREADAEERRLLYVAVTRARDELLLVGRPQPPVADADARPTWMQLVEAALPTSTEVVDADAILAADPPAPPPPPRPPPPDPDAAARVAPIAPRRRLELAASALDRFADCPARWYRGDLLGVPELPASARDRARALAAARGQVRHQVLEDGLEDDEGAVAARWSAAAARQGATPAEVEDGRRRVLAHLQATAASPAVERALAAPGWSEVGFRTEHAGIVLHGRIDRLWLDRDAAGFVVLDWKSEALDGAAPETAAGRHASQLRAYAWAADRVLAARGQPGVVRAEVVLTEVGAVVPLPLGSGALAAVPAMLEEVARVAAMPWAAVEAEAARGERPCAGCGFFRRGCRGAG